MEINKLKNIVIESHSYSECFRKLGWYDNGQTRKKIKTLIAEHKIDISHFDRFYNNRGRSKYNTIIKHCPVCKKQFSTQKDHPKEKTTCSYACSNTYFNGVTRNVNVTNYRTICFRSHQKQCIICGEDKIVEVHHLDHNNKNNTPDNLIPICSTHHRYWHSRYRKLIESQVDEYITNWKLKNKVL